MKKIAFLTLVLGLLAASAHASVTYYWHQTGASEPGILLIGRYTLIDPTLPVQARSDTLPIDLSNLASLRIEAQSPTQWWYAVSRSDMMFICDYWDPGCHTGEVTSWEANIIGDSPYMEFESLPSKWFYRVTANWIGLSLDVYGANPIEYGSDGYWSTDAVYVPAPATLPLALSALALLGFTGRRRSNARKR